MKISSFVLSALALSLLTRLPAKDSPPPLPTEVTLNSGLVLHDVSVVRWQHDVVVLKHRAGIDPIPYSRIIYEQRVIFEANRADGLAGETKKKEVAQKRAAKEDAERQAKAADDAAAVEKQRAIEDALDHHNLAIGMSVEQAKKSWGSPDSINRSRYKESVREDWIYRNRGIDEQGKPRDIYVYFEDGLLTSWQN